MKRSILIIITISSAFLFTNGFKAAEIYIPDDFPTIQEGINASESGDTVFVRPGTYYEHIIFTNILLKSTKGPNVTVIDGQGKLGEVTIMSNSILDGFTIRNGGGSPMGNAGGVHMVGTSTVINCWILENKGYTEGSGILCQGLPENPCDSTIMNNIIAYNHGHHPDNPDRPLRGAGIFIYYDVDKIKIINNTIIYNTLEPPFMYNLSYGAGICFYTGSTQTEAFVSNNIIAYNTSDSPDISGWDGQNMIFEHNLHWNNIGDHQFPDPYLAEDPLFIAGPDGEYYLSHQASGQDLNSPCIDQGLNEASYWGLDAFTTRTDGVPDMGIVDIGYHYPIPEGTAITTTIHSNQAIFESGDPFQVTLVVSNSGEEKTVNVYVVLDVVQNYWFWPSWSQTVDYKTWTLPANDSIEEDIFNLIWPETDSTGSATFWAATLNPENTELLGNYDSCTFEYK